MRRRDFITGIAGLAATWPVTGRTQQTKKQSRIGYLGPSSPSLERPQVDALRQSLRELGHVEGQDIAFEFQWAEGNDNRLPKLADELVRRKPDVIVTTGTPGTLAVKRATQTIPIVFASSGNPVNAGLVASYARPGGNVTGFTVLGPELEGKRVQLLKDAVPRASRVAMIWNSANPAIWDFYHQTRAAAAALSLTMQPMVEIGDPNAFKDAFSKITGAQPHAMIVLVDRFLLAHRVEIVNFAASNRVPTMYGYRGYVDAGGLMSYAPNDLDQYRRTAGYVDRILNGAKPADLPIQEPTRFEFVFNLKAAKVLGLDVPLHLQQLADEVIE